MSERLSESICEQNRENRKREGEREGEKEGSSVDAFPTCWILPLVILPISEDLTRFLLASIDVVVDAEEGGFVIPVDLG